jgi:hypothetical protein
MRDAAISAGVPRSSVYDVTLYLLAGLLVIGLVANLLVRSVAQRWFMLEAQVAALPGHADVIPTVQSPIASGLTSTVLLAWAAVGIPLLWGVWITLAKVAVLFR